MELVEGRTLDQLLQKGPLSMSQVLPLALEITDGLAVAHSSGVLHRDLKSENVMLTPSGHVKILDFGLARFQLDKPSSDDPDGLMGTPRSMAPEQIRGEPIDQRSDLFALGVLLYEMTTGHSPFLGPERTSTLMRICHHPHEPVENRVPRLPEGFSDLLDSLLAKDPTDRPASANAVMATLEQMSTPGRTERIPVPPSGNAMRPGSSHEATKKNEIELVGERLLVSLMACDLVGTDLDPELFVENLPRFQALANQMIDRYGGHLYDLQGHRLLACFGHPASYEDHARRAVLAALEIRTRSETTLTRLEIRAMVHSGPAVANNSLRKGKLTLGETLDATTEQLASTSPGSIGVSSATHQLLTGLGHDALEASAATEPAITEAFTALCRARPREETPLLGRESDLEVLLRRFELASEGSGQALAIIGEAGSGKTRLVQAFRSRLQENVGWIVARGICWACERPFLAVGSLVRGLLEIDRPILVEDRLSWLSTAIAEVGLPLDSVPVFAALLGLPSAECPEAPEIRRRMLELVPALIEEATARRPIVLLIEDAQWLDPLSAELVDHWIGAIKSMPALLLLTCRSGEKPFWRSRSHLSRLRLRPLSEQTLSTLVERLAGNDLLPEETRGQIVERSAGNPLYAENLVRSVLGGATCQQQIPAPLEALLKARLDRLGSACDIARMVAILEVTSLKELAGIVGVETSRIESELRELLEAGILVWHGKNRLKFSDPMLREVASASVLEVDRQRLRRRLETWRSES